MNDALRPPSSPARPTTAGRRLCVAPMMDLTDRHDRYLLRLISRHSWLYSEMLTTGAILHGDRDYLLGFHPAEHPVALQLGGSDQAAMAECAAIGQQYGFDEININVGCPSDRVQSGRFGACLMAEPGLVAECVAAMRQTVDIPVTVKSRTGIDERDSYPELVHFVDTIAAAGCRTFIVHARKAWLKGLSPKQNRDIPPLRYERVHQLKADFPGLEIIINGGLHALEEAESHLHGEQALDGAMIGRAAYSNPYLLAGADRLFYGADHDPPGRHEVVERYVDYVREQMQAGVRLSHMSRHIVGLFQGQPGARAWRRHISEQAHRPGAGVEVLLDAAEKVRPKG